MKKCSLTPKSAVGLLGLAVFYVFGVMAAQYITYTPVGLPHVAGVQARYLLPAFLMLFVLAAALLSHVLAPARAGGSRAEGLRFPHAGQWRPSAPCFCSSTISWGLCAWCRKARSVPFAALCAAKKPTQRG